MTDPATRALAAGQSWRKPEHADIQPDPEFAGRCAVCGAHLEVRPQDGVGIDAYGRQQCESTGEPHVVA
jgi:hypothetical protein